MRAGSSDDSDSDEERVVRSAKDKRFIELRQTVAEVDNKSKISDWLTITTLFDKLNKQLDKTMRTAQTSEVPKFYFRCLARLDDVIERVFADKPTVKKFSSTNSKAFNSIRQRLRKHQRDDASMAAGVAAAKEKMESTDEEMSDASDDDSDDEAPGRGQAQDAGDDDGFETVGKGGKTTSKKGKGGAAEPVKELDVMKCPKDKITYEMVEKKLKEIITSRGKKGTDRHENVEALVYLAEVSKCAAQEIEVLIMLISAQFDISGSMSTHMPIPIWKRCVNNLLRVRQLLARNKQISLTENAEPEARPAADEIVAGAPVQLWGSSARSPSASMTSTSSPCSPSTPTPRSTSSACRTRRCSSSSPTR